MAKLVVIAGPTAVGKSGVALQVAKNLGAEIISADSVQVYRHLDIGAAKPSAAEREAVPHHLLDIVEPHENYTVADYQRDARIAIADVLKRGNLPLLTGGTGLYIRSVIRNYAFSETGQNESVRRQLYLAAEKHGTEYLHKKLAQCDPQSAAKIHHNDLRRIIRALEVYEESSTPLSRQAAATTCQNQDYELFIFGLTMPRELLYRRIEQRVDKMMENGLAEEVRGLLDKGVSPGSKAMSSLGYRHMTAYLQGHMSLDEAIELLKRDTRRYAKRQLTWFKREENMAWYDVSIAGTEKTAENICNLLAGYY